MTEEQIEIWKDIPNYEGLYQISSFGIVKSIKRRSPMPRNGEKCTRTRREKILKLYLNSHGYLKVGLFKDYKVKTFQVHQLVAMAFLGHKPNGMIYVTNHKNFIRNDNRLENLEVVTPRENGNLKHIPHSSIYTGVSYMKKSNRWQSRININGKIKHLGYFSNEKNASEYYEAALISLANKTEIKVRQRPKTSLYKGVSWNKQTKRWVAQIRTNGKYIFLGRFYNESEAAAAYVNEYNAYYGRTAKGQLTVGRVENFEVI